MVMLKNVCVVVVVVVFCCKIAALAPRVAMRTSSTSATTTTSTTATATATTRDPFDYAAGSGATNAVQTSYDVLQRRMASLAND